jgi:uncharacterized protein (TIGR00255 family)
VLFSMTGYGEANFQSEQLSLAVEMRTVNNRYLKVVLRAAEPYNLLEPEFEKVIRRTVRRGTVQVHFRCQRQYAPQDFRVNAVALRSFLTQIRALCGEMGLPDAERLALLGQVLALPGVVPEPADSSFSLEEEWPLIEKVLGQALNKLQAMRREEGQAMARELLQLRDHIAGHLAEIRERLPSVAVAYRDRVLERVRTLLGELDVQIDRNDLIKEVSVFADRADVTEEVVRLASHLEQFAAILDEPESPGRKLDFLTQEMLRETNTLGSKASDVEVSRHVFEIKGTLEKIRELVQNVE